MTVTGKIRIHSIDSCLITARHALSQTVSLTLPVLDWSDVYLAKALEPDKLQSSRKEYEDVESACTCKLSVRLIRTSPACTLRMQSRPRLKHTCTSALAHCGRSGQAKLVKSAFPAVKDSPAVCIHCLQESQKFQRSQEFPGFMTAYATAARGLAGRLQGCAASAARLFRRRLVCVASSLTKRSTSERGTCTMHHES